MWRLSVQPGDLVKMTKARIGVPLGSVGLILKTYKVENTVPFTEELIYHDVQLLAAPERTVRRMPKDLEVISASQ